jgi:hypothetical protein
VLKNLLLLITKQIFMKKLHLLQCFDVTDAVKDGIEDFNRLSGYSCKSKIISSKHTDKNIKNPFKILWVVILAIIIKYFK